MFPARAFFMFAMGFGDATKGVRKIGGGAERCSFDPAR
jgi:hypothetical protein